MMTNDTLAVGAAALSLTDTHEPSLEAGEAFAYHAVPVWRFLLFNLFTLGGYTHWWAYRCWKGIKLRDGSDIWPLARGIFLPFTLVGLISDINLHRVFSDAGRAPLGGWLGGAYFFCTSLSLLAAPFNLLSWLGLAFLLPVLMEMRALSRPRTLEEKGRWGLRHIALLLAGVLLWTAVLLGAQWNSEQAHHEPNPGYEALRQLSR